MKISSGRIGAGAFRGAALLFALAFACASLEIPRNEYGLAVVESIELHDRIVEQKPDHELVDLRNVLSSARFEIRYATDNNFMKRRLYPSAEAWLRRPAAEALQRVEAELARQGLALKIYDAYRPYEVTRQMWEPYKDPDYVADPARGSRHNRGAAVDLTLVQMATGEPLDMGTDYDDFTPAASHSYRDLEDQVLRNRILLRSVMERHGFLPLASEWWHYDFSGWEDFALLDLSFDELRN